MPRKLPELKVTYHYVEPKTTQEKEDQERRVHQAFDILFEATLESEGWKQYKARKSIKSKPES